MKFKKMLHKKIIIPQRILVIVNLILFSTLIIIFFISKPIPFELNNLATEFLQKTFDTDSSYAEKQIRNAIAEGNYEKANELYIEVQDAPVNSKAYENLKYVREHIEFYRRFMATKDIVKNNEPNQDWGVVINNLSDMPVDFLYKNEVYDLLSKAENKETTQSNINEVSQELVIEDESSNNSTIDWGCEVVNDKTTACGHPADSRMSTVEELNIAVNTFRGTHALNQLEINSTLCNIAQSRANELLAYGALDGHAGFEKYAKNQSEFDSMSEVLYGGIQPQFGVHIVEWGWARSQTGHRGALLNPKWHAGCGGISGYYAVYIFGQRP